MVHQSFGKITGYLAAGLFLASLAACGGSSKEEPAQVTADLPAISLSAANVDLAKAVGAALAGKSVSLPSSLDLPQGQKAENVPASTLAFTAVPAGAPANAITGVTLRNEYYEARGFAMPGSLNIFINQLIWLGTPNPAIWTPVFESVFTPLVTPSFLFPSFAVDFQTVGLPLGFSGPIPGVVSFGPGLTVPITTPVNVTTSNGQTSIAVGGANLPVSTQPATGATGGTN